MYFDMLTNIIDVINDYVYLGVTMCYDNIFANGIWNQLDQGRRDPFSCKLYLPFDVKGILFEKKSYYFMVLKVPRLVMQGFRA